MVWWTMVFSWTTVWWTMVLVDDGFGERWFWWTMVLVDAGFGERWFAAFKIIKNIKDFQESVHEFSKIFACGGQLSGGLFFILCTGSSLVNKPWSTKPSSTKPSSTKICGRSEEIRDMTDRSLDTPEVLKIKAKIAKTLSKMQKFRAARALSNNSFLFDINEF